MSIFSINAITNQEKMILERTFFRFPVTLIPLRSDFPTLKSTAVIPPSSLKAT